MRLATLVEAFGVCRELKSMTISDSLETLGEDVFLDCPLPPSYIKDVGDETTAVFVYLRMHQIMQQ